jgi:large subunit ribosomal protein L13
MKTYSPKPEHVERRWYVLDARDQVLGRLASEVAHILRGKHKPIYAPHADVGDHVIIVNASKIVLTGGKETKKVAYRHSGHPGGITATLYQDLLAKRPAFAVEKAVRGMLPKNRLGRAMIKKLHVEAGPEHRHQAQRPEAWTVGQRPAWEGLPVRPEPVRRDAATAEGPATKPATGTAAKRSAARPGAKATTARKTTAAKRTGTAGRATSKTKTSGSTTSRKTTTKKATTPTASKKTTARKTTAKKTTAKTTAKKPTARSKKET